MSRFTAPASQTASVVFEGSIGRRSLTATGDLSYNPSKTTRSQLADAHTPIAKHQLKHKVGTFKMTAVTDQDLGWVNAVEDAKATLTFLNGRIVTCTGVTFASDDGLEENTTQGTTGELTFTFVTGQDKDA